MSKAVIMLLRELAKDLKEGGKKTKVIVLAFIAPVLVIVLTLSYYASWYKGMFSAQVEECLSNSLIRNSVYAFVDEIDVLELDDSEDFIKQYFIKNGKCTVPNDDDYLLIQNEYNLSEAQIIKIKRFVEDNTEYSEYVSIGEPGYVSSVNQVTSCYGPRWGKFHYGIDIAGPGNPPVFSYDKGIVIESSFNNVFGYYVVVEHSSELKTRYFHLYEPGVTIGKKVKKGEQIGVMGNTGDSQGVHLHFEIMINDIQIDPYPYLITTGIVCNKQER